MTTDPEASGGERPRSTPGHAFVAMSGHQATPIPNTLQLRTGGWLGRARPASHDPLCAHLITVQQGTAVSATVLRSWLRELRAAGYRSVRTGAVSAAHLPAYEAIGFVTTQTLTLLRADLGQWPSLSATPPTGHRARRGFDSDVGELSDVDHRAFPDGWGMDAQGLREAMAATSTHRLRIVERTGRISTPVAFAISGRSARAAFLQRLAVDPAVQRLGIARTLVLDCLRWAKRWRCTTMTVNTQDTNSAALALYQTCGFTHQHDSLFVLDRTLVDLP